MSGLNCARMLIRCSLEGAGGGLWQISSYRSRRLYRPLDCRGACWRAVKLFAASTTSSPASAPIWFGLEAMEFIEGDLADPAVCAKACAGVEIVFHEAALASVPRSVADPVAPT
jgi:hypothetical protein